MTRRTMNLVLAIASLASLGVLGSDAFAGGCQTKCRPGFGYQQDVELQTFLLLRQNPLLAARHAGLAARLNLKYARALKPNQLITVNGKIAGGQQVIASQPAQAAAVPAGAATPVAGSGPAAPAATPAAAAAVPAAAAATPAAAAPAAGNAAAQTPAAPADGTVSDLPSDLPTSAPPAGETANVVPSELQPLLGLWRNVTKRPDGSEQITEIELAANGNAKVTVEAGLLGKQTIEGQFAVKDGNFNVKKGEETITLGKVEKAEKDEVILKRGDLAFNFTRP